MYAELFYFYRQLEPVTQHIGTWKIFFFLFVIALKNCNLTCNHNWLIKSRLMFDAKATMSRSCNQLNVWSWEKLAFFNGKFAFLVRLSFPQNFHKQNRLDRSLSYVILSKWLLPDAATRCRTTPELTSRIMMVEFVNIRITFKFGWKMILLMSEQSLTARYPSSLRKSLVSSILRMRMMFSQISSKIEMRYCTILRLSPHYSANFLLLELPDDLVINVWLVFN